jgi:hypothetical protein
MTAMVAAGLVATLIAPTTRPRAIAPPMSISSRPGITTEGRAAPLIATRNATDRRTMNRTCPPRTLRIGLRPFRRLAILSSPPAVMAMRATARTLSGPSCSITPSGPPLSTPVSRGDGTLQPAGHRLAAEGPRSIPATR